MTDKNKKIIEQINSGIIPDGYKKTKVGIVPAEWTIEKFFSFCDVVNGGTPNTEISDYWNGNIFWCTPTDITNSGKYIDKTDKKITLKGLKNSSANLLPVNSILMCSRATIGPRSINTVPMATNQGFKSLIVDKKKADLLFINEILELCVPIFIRKSCGSTFLELSKKDVGNQLIPFPPLPEQQKIAEILSTQDKLIELYERKIEQLKTLKKGYLQKMFPKKGCKYPELRFKGFTDDWEQFKLGNYVIITSGEAPSKFEVGDELYIKVDDLNYTAKYIVESQNKVALHKSIGKVSKGSVIFPKRGAAIMTNKVRILAEDSYMDTNMMALTSTGIDSEFLYNVILNEGLYKIADTSTIPQINNKHIEPYEVMLPEFDEQRMIGEFFASLDHLITLHQHKLDKEKQKKKALMQLLLTGKVRVST